VDRTRFLGLNAADLKASGHLNIENNNDERVEFHGQKFNQLSWTQPDFWLKFVSDLKASEQI